METHGFDISAPFQGNPLEYRQPQQGSGLLTVGCASPQAGNPLFAQQQRFAQRQQQGKIQSGGVVSLGPQNLQTQQVGFFYGFEDSDGPDKMAMYKEFWEAVFHRINDKELCGGMTPKIATHFDEVLAHKTSFHHEQQHSHGNSEPQAAHGGVIDMQSLANLRLSKESHKSYL